METLALKIEACAAHFAPAETEDDFDPTALPGWEEAATSRTPETAPEVLRTPMKRIQWLYYQLNRTAARILNPDTDSTALPALRRRLADLNETRDLLNDQLRRLNAHIEATHDDGQAVSLRLNYSQLNQKGSKETVSAIREYSFELPAEWATIAPRLPSNDET